MHTWTWTEHEGNAYLRCSLLDEWPHGFFTQHWWPQPPADLVRAIAPESHAYRVKQVHGNTVLTIEEWHHHQQRKLHEEDADNPGSSDKMPLPEADGVMSDHDSHTVWVATADCVPALIADASSGHVAAVHAGWRGTAQKIVPITIQRFLDHGSQLSDLRVALGPAIAGEVYQVSTTVAAQVGATVMAHSRTDTPIAPSIDDVLQTEDDHHPAVAPMLQHLKTLARPAILDDPQPGRARLDVRRINEMQLEQLGLSPDQVAIAPHCTYQEGDRFFSYRRTRQKKVQWSGIASRPPG